MRMSKLAANDASPISRANYKLYRNVYNRVIKMAKKNFYERELIANQSNLKKTWDLIRSAANLPKINREGISQMLIDGVLVNDPLTIATKFNEFFTTMPATIVNEIIPPSVPPEPEHLNDPSLPVLDFSNNPVTRSEVWDAFKALNFNKSKDVNHISLHFLSKIFYHILKPVHHFVKVSLETGSSLLS